MSKKRFYFSHMSPQYSFLSVYLVKLNLKCACGPLTVASAFHFIYCFLVYMLEVYTNISLMFKKFLIRINKS